MAKRISATSLNWAAVIEKFEPKDREKLSAFKSVVEKYVRELSSRPAELKKIDWNHYKARITVPGLVDSFQKSYESLNVPYPTDQGLVAEAEKYNDNFLKKTDARLNDLKAELEKQKKQLQVFENEMPYVDMTLEEFYLARPDLRIDPDKPQLWPQNIEKHVQSSK